MADMYTSDADHKNHGAKKFLYFLLGLIIGLIIGAIVGYMLGSKDTDDNATNGIQTSSTSMQTTSSNVIPAEGDAGARTDLTTYSQLLVEASREGVDVPSDEASAAKAALDGATNDLAKTIGASDTLHTDMQNVNNSLLTYAGTARTSDEHATVDQAFTTLATDLKSAYKVADTAKFDSQVTSLKNTLLEGIRNFAQNNYSGSYDKQLQAEQEISNVFGQLQKK